MVKKALIQIENEETGEELKERFEGEDCLEQAVEFMELTQGDFHDWSVMIYTNNGKAYSEEGNQYRLMHMNHMFGED